jgi:hypothetical protein
VTFDFVSLEGDAETLKLELQAVELEAKRLKHKVWQYNTN